MKTNWRPLAATLLLVALAGPATAQEAEHPGLEPCLAFLRLPARSAVTRMLQPNDAVRDAFGRFDRDGDGWLSADEVSRYVRDPEDLPPDLDGDGRVSSREFLLAVAQTAPPGADLYSVEHARSLLLGRRAFDGGNFREALLHYWKAANESRDCPDGVLGMGRCLARLGLDGEAAKAFRLAVELSPGLAEARLDLALAEERLGRRDEALAGLKLMLRQFEAAGRLRDGWRAQPAWRAGVLGLAAALERRLTAAGTMPEAAAELRGFLARNAGAESPRPALPQMELCGVGDLLERGAYREAMGRLQGLRARLPRDWEVRMTEAALWTLLGRFDAARESLAAAGALGAFPEVLLPAKIGNSLDLGDEAGAALLTERLRRLPLEFWELSDLAWQFVYRGRYREALAPLAKLAEHKAGAGAVELLLLALCQHATGEPARAREVLRQTPHPASGNPVLLDLEARLCLNAGLEEESLEALRLARRLWPPGLGLAPLMAVAGAWFEARPAEAAARLLPAAAVAPASQSDSSRKMR